MTIISLTNKLLKWPINTLVYFQQTAFYEDINRFTLIQNYSNNYHNEILKIPCFSYYLAKILFLMISRMPVVSKLP